ncbi:oligosaccharide flippase family protein [Polynucleobacter sp. CS-Odin-A6]|uniref:oligosaccharide flippase family protein n=1 Tax=Polynucleobacter sp. CS-Odin-A6 TaxID=2689106 RepID=UPI001C0B7EE3|nr:oligosaccharide flippase family protein [Polynucleobacter sp. CS-Odin-A6]MBU3621111.1 oligosaccharide flippase family protein [Polynucleobacter sp. CS-Odin-A6]
MKNIIDGIKWNGLAGLMLLVIKPISNLFMARLLMPEEFGEYAYIFSIVSIAWMLRSFGLEDYIITNYEKDNRNRMLSTVQFINLLSASLIGLLIVILVYIYLYRYFEIAVILVLAQFISSYFVISHVLINANLDFKISNIIGIASNIVGVTIGISLAYAGYGIWSIVLMTTSKIIIDPIISTLYIGKLFKPKLYRNELYRIKEFCSKYYIGNMITRATDYMDKIAIGKTTSSTDLGLYTQSSSIANLIFSTIDTIISGVTIPILSRKNTSINERDRFLIIYEMLISFSILLSTILIFKSKLIIIILLGSKWLAATNILSVISLIGLLGVVNNYLKNFLIIKNIGSLLNIKIITFFIFIISIFPLTKIYGINGCLISLISYNIVYLLMQIFNINLEQYRISIFKITFKYLCILIISIFITYIINFEFHYYNNFYQDLVEILTFISIYIVLTIVILKMNKTR